MSLFRTFPTGGDFAPLFRLLDDYDTHRQSRGQVSSVRSFAPRFDVRESETAYHFDGELPGISQKDIDIEFTDPQTLVIKGRTEREYHSPEADETSEAQGEGQAATKDENKPHFWVSERSVGEFNRTFTLPSRVDQEKVKASLQNGILSVVVPKADAYTRKKITIE
ncbi:HSP20-like chaperone [Aspergillus bertholletiae]|uniref:HSP20-like chaperone n=1 Tax=Aspergillus bertholletiae TaxID=1226010 RepID=A0A5N7BI66_9EURO|nr:HSP20-like chaperone [Aspergillus bertholletiae]